MKWTGFSPDGGRREGAARVGGRRLRGEHDHRKDEGKADKVGNAKGYSKHQYGGNGCHNGFDSAQKNGSK